MCDIPRAILYNGSFQEVGGNECNVRLAKCRGSNQEERKAKYSKEVFHVMALVSFIILICSLNLCKPSLWVSHEK